MRASIGVKNTRREKSNKKPNDLKTLLQKKRKGPQVVYHFALSRGLERTQPSKEGEVRSTRSRKKEGTGKRRTRWVGKEEKGRRIDVRARNFLFRMHWR